MRKAFALILRVFMVIWVVIIIAIHYENMSKDLLKEHQEEIAAMIRKLKR